jgi:2-iminobutanoate/2-iminopropanoate deaminase
MGKLVRVKHKVGGRAVGCAPVAEKRAIRTENAPAPFQGAPYSQGIVFGDLVFVSGQVAVDPSTNEPVQGGIEAQTERTLENVKAILEEAGSSLDKVLKASIFLADFADFAAMNEVYGRYMGETPPARATVQVGGLPSGVRIEIEVVAHV